ncbi:MAG: Flp family type IVb pilin [Candidatus Desulforudis sp.]|nr:Flp family type IVb pilin [Desulforudis sp.]
MLKLFERLFKEEEGQGLVEYALILVLIAIVVIAALSFLGGKVNETFNNVGTTLDSAV